MLRALIAYGLRPALTAGTFTIGLELRATNFAARGFYAALGYRVTDCVRGYYQGVENAIHMARDVRRTPPEAARLPQAQLALRPWLQGWDSSNYWLASWARPRTVSSRTISG